MEDILKEGIPDEQPQFIPQSNPNSEIDKELEEILKKQSARIKVIGVGGGGGNTTSRMREIGIKGGEIIAINTDAQDLHHNKAAEKVHIGKNLTKGLGAGMNPDVGRQAAEENRDEMQEVLKGTDMVFCNLWFRWWNRNRGSTSCSSFSKKNKEL